MWRRSRAEILLLLGLVVLAVVLLSRDLLTATMTDTQALQQAQMRWGARAATSLMRRAENGKLLRCVGYMTTDRYMTVMGCSEGSNWEAAFAAVAPVVVEPGVIQVSTTKGVYCAPDLTKTVKVSTLFGAVDAPGYMGNCVDRLYLALQEIRAGDPLKFDSLMLRQSLWFGDSGIR